MKNLQEYIEHYRELCWFNRSGPTTLQRIEVMASPPVVKDHRYTREGEPELSGLRTDDVHERLFRFETEGQVRYRRDVAEELGQPFEPPEEQPYLIVVPGGPPGQGVKRHSNPYLNQRIARRTSDLIGQTVQVRRLKGEDEERAAQQSPYLSMIRRRSREVSRIAADPDRSLEGEGRFVHQPREDRRIDDERLERIVKKAAVRERHGLDFQNSLTELERRRAELMLPSKYHPTIHKLEQIDFPEP